MTPSMSNTIKLLGFILRLVFPVDTAIKFTLIKYAGFLTWTGYCLQYIMLQSHRLLRNLFSYGHYGWDNFLIKQLDFWSAMIQLDYNGHKTKDKTWSRSNNCWEGTPVPEWGIGCRHVQVRGRHNDLRCWHRRRSIAEGRYNLRCCFYRDSSKGL